MSECGTTAVGESHWLRYANTGSGFAATPTTWSLPGAAHSGDESFDTLSRTESYAARDPVCGP